MEWYQYIVVQFCITSLASFVATKLINNLMVNLLQPLLATIGNYSLIVLTAARYIYCSYIVTATGL